MRSDGVPVSVMSAREVTLFALRWDERYWLGQLRIPGCDVDRIQSELSRLARRIAEVSG